MAGIKELKIRIKSIRGTRKITRAMQMVSAAKMKRAQNATVSSRSYSEMAWEIIKNLSRKGAFSHPLIKAYPDAQKVGVILISSNKGLVGSLNANLIYSLKQVVAEADTSKIIDLITYGKKGQILAGRLGKNINADFQKIEKGPKIEDIYPISQYISDAYAKGEYSKFYLIYNFFNSTLSQKPVLKQLLPFSDDLLKQLEDPDNLPTSNDIDYVFEPDVNQVLEHLVPRILESQIYQAVLEAEASEHSARMIMMKNATEAAGDLISDLTLTFNQLRQNKITTELAEITSGKIALE
ncbi:MAG: ATP synthase F1 subunit gamma [Candidatus Doudnabacteria bacterium]|nr:ATP synthase F1 subunit gamma [Candidatus Doudnabacteria bacterium]